MRVAVTSSAAEQLASANIAGSTGWKFFPPSHIEEIASFNPDVIYLGGVYIGNYSDWQGYRAILGDARRVIMHWYGSDVVQVGQFHREGSTGILEWLKSDRFLHIAPSGPLRQELVETLGIETGEPINVPAEKVFGDIPLPSGFVIGCYMPPQRQKFFNLKVIDKALSPRDDLRIVFYHWLPLMEKLEYRGKNGEYRFGLSREEYEKTLADCSCLLRIPAHDADSISAAEFLMSGRPVVSNHDLPMWPRLVSEQMEAPALAEAVIMAKDIPVSATVREFYRDRWDPAKFKARLVERCKTKWPEVEL